MARVKSTTLKGATPFETDVDALTLSTTLKNACGDAALTYDRVTGENGEPNPVNHKGAGFGSLLGIPLWNQYIGRSLNYVGTGTAKGGTPGLVLLLAQPFWVPRGETTMVVQCVIRDGNVEALAPTVRITSSTGTTRNTATLTRTNEGSTVWAATLSPLTEGLNLAFLEVQTAGQSLSSLYLESWHAIHPRARGRLRGQRSVTRAEGSATAVGVETPTSTQALFHQNFDDSWFATSDAYDGFITSHLDRNLNALAEWGSGWPAGGNSAYTHEDQTSAGVPDPTNPDRSRFHAATRTLLLNEGQPDFPLWSEAFGAIGADGVAVVNVGAAAPTVGMLQWFAPFPLTGALTTITQLLLRYPDFQSTSSRLRCAVLIGTNTPGTLGNWTARVANATGNASATFGAAFNTAITTGAPLALAQITAVPFTGDAIEVTSIDLSATAFSGTYEEMHLLGACLYYEGT